MPGMIFFWSQPISQDGGNVSAATGPSFIPVPLIPQPSHPPAKQQRNPVLDALLNAYGSGLLR